MPTLAVVPNDPISAYEAKGTHVWAERYYNPGKFFDKVYLLSPLEKEEKFQYGMQTIPTRPQEFRRRLRQVGADLVRAYGGGWCCELACTRKAAGIPVVVSVHDTTPTELSPAVRRADYVFCVSKAIQRLVASRHPDPDRLWLLYNRFDGSIMHPVTDDDFADLDAAYPFRYRLLCVGRLSEQKNQDGLIRALAELGPDYGCLFLGRNEPDALKALARDCGVERQCIFIESVRNDLMPRYYSWADAMVLPSRWEGFSVAITEALACGAMVVVSNIPPTAEVVRHEENGLLIDDYENPSAIAEQLRRACEDKQLAARLRAAAPPSIAELERDQIDALEISYYQRILDQRQANPPRVNLIEKFLHAAGRG